MKPTKVLFILKQRGEPYYGLSSDTNTWKNRSFTGLSNSVRYVVEMLKTLGIEASAAEVPDNNAIDAAVTKYQPTHVIIEALWVVPDKFKVLLPRHPGVFWNVRLHSEVPFVAQEGIAMAWIFAYLKAGLSVSANSLRMQANLAPIVGSRIEYTPNYYPLTPIQPYNPLPADDWIDIGCFGAIRPLKNQLTQAFAAIEFAGQIGKRMRFHINADRVEGGAMAVLHNLQALFANQPGHQLVEHGWMDRAAFFSTLKNMDLAMQVSFSETFNIVSADAAVLDVPLVVSPEVTWADTSIQAEPSHILNIVSKMHIAWNGKASNRQRLNYAGLQKYDAASEQAWPIALRQMAGLA